METIEDIGTLSYRLRVVTTDEADPAQRTQRAQLVAVTSTAQGSHEGIAWESDPGPVGVAIDVQTAVLDKLGVKYADPTVPVDPNSNQALVERIRQLEAERATDVVEDQAVQPGPVGNVPGDPYQTSNVPLGDAGRGPGLAGTGFPGNPAGA